MQPEFCSYVFDKAPISHAMFSIEEIIKDIPIEFNDIELSLIADNIFTQYYYCVIHQTGYREKSGMIIYAKMIAFYDMLGPWGWSYYHGITISSMVKERIRLWLSDNIFDGL